jgi:hypothetical protein
VKLLWYFLLLLALPKSLLLVGIIKFNKAGDHSWVMGGDGGDGGGGGGDGT